MQYLLSCSCGQKVRVEPAQAGGRVTCACGQTLSVPTLRGLKALEVAEPDEAARRRAAGRQWGPLQGTLFSVGLLLSVVSIGAVIYLFTQYIHVSMFTVDLTPEFNQYEAAQIDEFAPLEALQVFYELREQGLGERQTPFWVTAQQVTARQRWMMIAAGVLAVVGVLAAVAGLLIKTPQTVPRR